jgi:hypothetical protein
MSVKETHHYLVKPHTNKLGQPPAVKPRRKLSGAFLACMKLRARVPCRQLFYEAYDAFVSREGEGEGEGEGDEKSASGAAATA